MAVSNNVPLLGRIPLHIAIRKSADAGTPLMMLESESILATHYSHIAFALIEQLSLQPINYAVKFPKIVVERKNNAN